MRRLDDMPLDPEIAAQLNAIDATLAGEPVDPQFAEIAELALLVTAGRPTVSPEFAAAMDRKVENRFRAGETAAPGWAPPVRSRWRLIPLAGGCAAAVAAVVVAILVLGSGHGQPHQVVQGLSAEARGNALPDTRHGPISTSTNASFSSSSSGAAAAAGVAAATTPMPSPGPQAVAGHKAEKSAAPSTPAFGSAAYAPAINEGAQPVPSARKVIQSAQLALTAQHARVDQVAQEAFDVIGSEKGIVNHSAVTAGNGGYAQISLSVPSGNLASTMTALSELRYATVAQRTDLSSDVNDSYLSQQRHLADAKALRTSLLKQLAAAYTSEQVDSLKAQLKDVEATITSDENGIDSLNKQVNLSTVQLTINAGPAPKKTKPKKHHESGLFTLHKAAHDAGRVLVVAAGVALIALAVLVPFGLLAALLMWMGFWLRRRGREHALDAN